MDEHSPEVAAPYREKAYFLDKQNWKEDRRFQEVLQFSEQTSNDRIWQLEHELEVAKKDNLRLQEEAKNALPARMMADKLDEKAKEHEAATVDLRLCASNSDGYKADVDRLKEEVKRLEGSNGKRQDLFDNVVRRKDELEKAAKDSELVLNARHEDFEALEETSKEQAELDRKEVDTLKDEITRLKGVQSELAAELGRVNLAVKEYYPEVADEAKKSALRALGVEATAAAMSSYRPTIEDRVAQLVDEARTLANAGREVFECLWPRDMAPRVFSKLACHLDDAPNTILELRESAARKGAEWALTLMISWYPATQPGQLTAGFRGSDSYEVLRQRPDIRTTACTIANFVDLKLFIPNRVVKAADGEDEDEEESDGGADEGSDSHQQPAGEAAKGKEPKPAV